MCKGKGATREKCKYRDRRENQSGFHG
jgi:hypothetical protein